jgi:hypothetical protein
MNAIDFLEHCFLFCSYWHPRRSTVRAAAAFNMTSWRNAASWNTASWRKAASSTLHGRAAAAEEGQRGRGGDGRRRRRRWGRVAASLPEGSDVQRLGMIRGVEVVSTPGPSGARARRFAHDFSGRMGIIIRMVNLPRTEIRGGRTNKSESLVTCVCMVEILFSSQVCSFISSRD